MITTQHQIHSNGTAGGTSTLAIKVRDITGTHVAKLDLDRDLRVGAVAETVAARMSLPGDTAWALRDERTAAFLDDDRTIGEAVDTQDVTEVSLVVTPRAHLG